MRTEALLSFVVFTGLVYASSLRDPNSLHSCSTNGDCVEFCSKEGSIFEYCGLSGYCHCSIDSTKRGCPDNEWQCDRYCKSRHRDHGFCATSGPPVCWCSLS